MSISLVDGRFLNVCSYVVIHEYIHQPQRTRACSEFEYYQDPTESYSHFFPVWLHQHKKEKPAYLLQSLKTVSQAELLYLYSKSYHCVCV